MWNKGARDTKPNQGFALCNIADSSTVCSLKSTHCQSQTRSFSPEHLNRCILSVDQTAQPFAAFWCNRVKICDFLVRWISLIRNEFVLRGRSLGCRGVFNRIGQNLCKKVKKYSKVKHPLKVDSHKKFKYWWWLRRQYRKNREIFWPNFAGL